MTEDQLNKQLATFFGQVSAHIDARFEELRSDVQSVDQKVDGLKDTLDGLADAVMTDREERAAIGLQIDQLAGHTGATLEPKLEQ